MQGEAAANAGREDIQAETEEAPRSSNYDLLTLTGQTHLATLLPAIFFSILSGCVAPTLSWCTGRYFDQFSQYSEVTIDTQAFVAKTWQSTYLFLAIAGGALLFNGLFFHQWILFGERHARAVRRSMYNNLLSKDLDWFDDLDHGIDTFLARSNTHIRDIQLGLSQPLGLIVAALARTAASLGVALYADWKLSLAVIACAPVVTSVIGFSSRGLQEAIDNQQKQLAKATKHIGHILDNIVFIKCHCTEHLEKVYYSVILTELRGHFRSQARVTAIQTFATRFCLDAVIIFALVLGTVFLHHGLGEYGKILTAFWSTLVALMQFDVILTEWPILVKAQSAASIIKRSITVSPCLQLSRPSHHNLTTFDVDTDIELSAVHFAYASRPSHEVLKGASMIVRRGQTTVLIGPSGSGKSTIGNILLGFYPISAGSITVGGMSLERLDIHQVRENIALVQQDGVLFSDTIENNIKIGNSTPVSTSAVMNVLNFAGLSDAVRRMPESFQTRIGPNGVGLSGGQKQRVALARARLRDTPVLILDEATSALDRSSRQSLLSNIRVWRNGKTTLIITHDMSQIQPGDVVYTMKDGRITGNSSMPDLGSHHETPEPLSSDQSRSHSTQLLKQLSDQELSRLSIVSDSTIDDPDESVATPLLPQLSCGVPSLRPHHSSLWRGDKGIIRSPRLHTQHLAHQHQARRTRYAARQTLPRLLRPVSMFTVPPVNVSRFSPHSLLFNTRRSPSHEPMQLQVNNKQMSRPDSADNKSSASTNQVLRTIWPNLEVPQKMLISLGFCFVLIYAVSPSVTAWAMTNLMSSFQMPAETYMFTVKKWAFVMLGVAFGTALVSSSCHLVFDMSGQYWIEALRRRALHNLLKQPKSWFDQRASRLDICSAIDRDAEETRNLLARFAPFITIALLMVVIACAWSAVLCWKLTLVGLGCTPLIWSSSKLFDRQSRSTEKRVYIVTTEIASVLHDSFSAVKTVRALTLEKHFQNKYMQALERAYVIGKARAVVLGLCYGLVESMMPFVSTIIFGFSSYLIIQDRNLAQSVLTVIGLLLLSTVSANGLLGYVPQIAVSTDCAGRLLKYAYLDAAIERSGEEALAVTSDGAAVQLQHLTFHYPSHPKVNIFEKLDLVVPNGAIVAVAGSSGCGKSTLAALILALYTRSGSTTYLKIFSQSISRLDLSSLRRNIAYLPQSAPLLDCSVRDNILYGHPLPLLEASSAQLDSIAKFAAHTANVHVFISSLPQGYDTLLGSGGTSVSGGQAQRICLARAIARLSHASIMVLDEPTSALDDQNAMIVRTRLKALIEGEAKKGHIKTIIIITHDRETMKWADNIFMLDRGKLVEQGRYAELMHNRGEFWNMMRDYA